MADNGGRLAAIWVKRMKLGPMDPAERGELVAGKGLAGNANQGGRRQIILIEAEKWEEISRELGRTIDPITRRANFLVRGIDLEGSRERVLRVGDTRLLVLGESRGCNRMEEAETGLLATLRQNWRGGAFAQVLDGGEIAVGDPVRWEDSAPAD